MGNIRVLQELKDFIIPLSKEEFNQLELNIQEEGLREALSVWVKDGENILVDGHNRYKISKKHAIEYKVKEYTFDSIEDVKQWMINNQLGRRNLTPDQLSYYRGLKYLGSKKKKGGYNNVLSKGQIEETTSKILSQEFMVSESTIKRDSKFAESLNVIAASNPKLKKEILSGEVKISKSDLLLLLKDDDIKEYIIVNESDLHHKIKIIKDELLANVEIELTQIEEDKKEEEIQQKAIDIVNGVEPLFLDKEDRLKRIKGRILSAINRAINNNDIESIKVLKSLVDTLEDELIDEIAE